MLMMQVFIKQFILILFYSVFRTYYNNSEGCLFLCWLQMTVMFLILIC